MNPSMNMPGVNMPAVDMGWCFMLSVTATLTFWFWYLRLLKLSAPYALLAAAGAVVLADCWYFSSAGSVIAESPLLAGQILRQPLPTDSGVMLALFAFVFAVGFGFGLVIKVYRAWILDLADPAERAPNAAGFRAWLSPMNSINVAFFSIATVIAIGPGWITFLGAIGLLLAYPVINIALQSGTQAPSQDAPDLASERQRVLALVEAGKVSAEDGAELITALGQSRVIQAEQTNPLSPGRRVVLLGALLVLLGFCMPWFEIRIDDVMKTAMQNLQQAAGQAMPGFPQMPNTNINNPFATSAAENPAAPQTMNLLLLRGGDLEHGMGWIIMLAAVGAALLPFVWPARQINRQNERGFSIVALGAGSIALIYLVFGLSMGPPRAQIGFVLVCIGYVIVWIGAVREYIQIPALAHPAVQV
jgi:hypothetical protein